MSFLDRGAVSDNAFISAVRICLQSPGICVVRKRESGPGICEAVRVRRF